MELMNSSSKLNECDHETFDEIKTGFRFDEKTNYEFLTFCFLSIQIIALPTVDTQSEITWLQRKT